VAVIQTILLNFDPAYLQVTTNDCSWEGATIMFVICNGPREGGGFLVAPEAKPDDGILHYASIGKVSRLMMFRLIPEVMRGTHGRFKQVRMDSLKSMSLTSDRPLYIHLDGEIFSGFGTEVKKLSIEILPGVIQVMKSS
jgi:diacylglycerol kinase (ATP)